MLAHLADISARSLLLALLAAIVLWILRSVRTAALQHAVWATVVCGMLALFALGQTLPQLPLRVLDGPTPAATAPPPAASVDRLMPDASPSVATPPLSSPVPSKTRRPIDWSEAAVFAYGTIAIACLARFAMGMFLVRRLLAKSTAVRNFRESGLLAVPVTLGWLRPKILLPLEWRAWDRTKLDAVLVHEGAHVRRRDGLVAALAGISRCVFWFHPLAWWLERRLSLLAEQACDESSVATLGDRRQYAHLLLEMAKVVEGSHGRLRSHALTMAASSQIRKRVESILQEGRTFSRGLTGTGWAALALCGIPAVFGAGAIGLKHQAPLPPLEIPRLAVPAPPVLLAQAQTRPAPKAPTPAPRPEFEVASVKPSVPEPFSAGNGSGRGGGGGGGGACPESFRMDRSRVDAACLHLTRLIAYAYRMPVERVTVPDWLRDRITERFDIDAKIPEGVAENQVPEMFQVLLEDRFKLAVHRATTDQEVLGLVVAKGGLKVKEAAPQADAPAPDAAADPNAPPGEITLFNGVATHTTRVRNADGSGTTTRSNPLLGTVRETSGADQSYQWDAPSITLAGLADLVGGVGPLPAQVVDLTGLKGRYQVVMEIALHDAFAAAEARMAAGGDPAAMQDLATDLQSALLRALNNGLQKLGLQLERRKAPVETLFVDRVEKTPTGN